MTPLISVLLPTHNRCDVVGWAIHSVLAQTLPDFELLVIGDGCTDGTAAVVQAFDDPRVVWLDWPKSPHFGYANRNRALRQARGSIVAYLGHDDLWLPDHLERAAARLSGRDADWVYSRPMTVSMSGRIVPQIFDLRDPLTLRLWRTQHIGILSMSDVVHTAACLEQYGFWNEKVERGGDWELWMRILDGGGWRRFGYNSAPTALHFVAVRRRPESWRRALLRRVHAWEGPAAPALSVRVPDGMTEQEAVWRAMTQPSSDWVNDLRRGGEIDLDRRRRFATPVSCTLELLEWYRRRLIERPVRWPPYTA